MNMPFLSPTYYREGQAFEGPQQPLRSRTPGAPFRIALVKTIQALFLIACASATAQNLRSLVESSN